ncbi:MAG: TonB-dependent receptor [Proteobacteria bacterium]|nr:TonB-dependent receptor [Pseudomonadota bacterium]
MSDVVTVWRNAAALGVPGSKSRRYAAGAWVLACFVASTGRLWAAEPGDQVMEVVVTGSRLGTANTSSPSPVVVIDSEELAHQGTPRAEEFLNSLPQVNSGLTLGANGASVAPLTGTATADLRGIGAFRTLVLVNGRRTAPGDPINPSADLNTIPTALIKRVEVLTGGASAVYGSDAVAGVVNFILDTNFKGFKADIEGGVYRGSNDRSDLQSIALAGGVASRTGSGYDGRNIDASFIWGGDFLGGRGHVQAYAGFRHTQEVTGARRDYSACTLVEVGNSFQCLLDNSTATGQFVPNGGAGTPFTIGAGGAVRPLAWPSDYYNPASWQDLQRPDTRYNAGLFASLTLGEHAQLYSEAQYMRDSTTVHYEPTATDIPSPYNPNVPLTQTLPSTQYTINCADPQLSAGELAALCPGGASGTALVNIGRRNVEGGPRTDEFRHNSYRVVLGIKGELSEPWTYDADAVYSRVQQTETPANDFSAGRLANALNVVGVGGVPTCQSVVDGTDPGCVPYNIWSPGGVTPAALRYVTAGAHQSGYAERTIVTGQLVGDLKPYGVVSPFAQKGVSVAVGAEHRRETVHYAADAAYGDLLVTSAVNGSPHATGSFHVSEIFAEVKAPLVQEKPGVEDLVVSLSDRYAHYTPQGNVNAYGIGLEWEPTELVRARGSVSRAVRAPNAYELFKSQSVGQSSQLDPCAGPTPTASAAQCANSGVSAAQYGNIPNGNINVLTGGNPNLRPEIADSYTYGLVFTPAKNILLSVDYWHIKIKGFLGNAGISYTLATCLNTNAPVYCSLIQRGADGSLSGSGPNAGHVLSTQTNTGSFGTSGVDFEGRYALNLAQAQSLTFSFTGSYAIDNPILLNPASTQFDCTGLYGFNCSGNGPTSPVPRWRHRLRATWHTAHALELSLNWRHIGKMDSEYTNNRSGVADPTLVFPADSHIPAYDYLDFDAGMDVGEHLNVRVGINNLTDKQPPVIGLVASPQLVNGNMAAGMYDSLGRYLFAGVTARF